MAAEAADGLPSLLLGEGRDSPNVGKVYGPLSIA